MEAPFQEVLLFHSEVGGSVQLSLRVIQTGSTPATNLLEILSMLSLRVIPLRSKPSSHTPQTILQLSLRVFQLRFKPST